MNPIKSTETILAAGQIAREVLAAGPQHRGALSFVRCTPRGGLSNWEVERPLIWNDGLAHGVALFAECEALAANSEEEAYQAIRWALSEWAKCRGVEVGFAEQVARAAVDGLRARAAGMERFAPAE